MNEQVSQVKLITPFQSLQQVLAASTTTMAATPRPPPSSFARSRRWRRVASPCFFFVFLFVFLVFSASARLRKGRTDGRGRTGDGIAGRRGVFLRRRTRRSAAGVEKGDFTLTVLSKRKDLSSASEGMQLFGISWTFCGNHSFIGT